MSNKAERFSKQTSNFLSVALALAGAASAFDAASLASSIRIVTRRI